MDYGPVLLLNWLIYGQINFKPSEQIKIGPVWFDGHLEVCYLLIKRSYMKVVY